MTPDSGGASPSKFVIKKLIVYESTTGNLSTAAAPPGSSGVTIMAGDVDLQGGSIIDADGQN